MRRLCRQLQGLMISLNPAPRLPDHYTLGMQASAMTGPVVVDGSAHTAMSMQPQSPHQFMHHPEIVLQHQSTPQRGAQHRVQAETVAAAPPHQFLFREGQQEQQVPQHDSARQSDSKAARGTDPMKVRPTGIMPLPRSGQNMQLNFHHPGIGQYAPTVGGPPRSQPPHMMMAHGSVYTRSPYGPPPPERDAMSMPAVQGAPMAAANGGYMNGGPAAHGVPGGPVVVGD